VISYRSPWQNGVAERFVFSVKSEILNNVVIFHEEHLRKLMREYVDYYNNERCHLSVKRDSPNGRKIQNKPSESAKVISFPRLGGLHHVYDWEEAA
jgi:putative transposase